MKNIDLKHIAQKFMQSRPHMNGGLVLVVNGKACGWKDCLRDPQSEIPGTYAVDPDTGDTWQAVEGDNYNGALRWVVATP